LWLGAAGVILGFLALLLGILFPKNQDIRDEIKILHAEVNEIRAALATPTPLHIANFIPKLAPNPASLPADGQSQSQITVTVQDSAGNRAPDGTEVIFDQPPWGSLNLTGPLRLVNGQAQVVLIAGNIVPTPPEVAISVRIPGGQSSLISIQVTEMKSPRLEAGIQPDPNKPQLNLDEDIALTLHVRNVGNAPATNVTFTSNLPGTVRFERSDCAVNNNNQIIWSIAELQPQAEVPCQLVVRVNNNPPEGGQVASPEFTVQSDNTQPLQGQAGQWFIPLAAQPAEPVATKITLTPDGDTTLVANGKSQIRITAQILDQFNNSFTGTVEFRVDNQELGTVVLVEENSNIALFTAKNQPGEVKVIVSSGDIMRDLRISLIKPTPKLSAADPLYDGSPIINLLPAGTPISDRLGLYPNDETYEEIAIEVWVPKNILGQDNQGQYKIIRWTEDNSTGTPIHILVGTGSNDVLNQNQKERLLTQNILQHPVEKLDDNSDPDLAKVKIRGWVRTELITEE
jgi:uncharacterized repeat protein (TIGR01451 family)